MTNRVTNKKILLAFILIATLCLKTLFLYAADNNNSSESTSSTASSTVITIEQAQKTSSRKDSVTGNSIIVLTGGVVVSVKSQTSDSIVHADLVNYDRERSMLYAEGSVSLEKREGGKAQETLTAESLLLNTDTLEGVFNDGRVVQLQSTSVNVPDGSTLIVYSDVFGRDDAGTITFKNGSLTLCDDPTPHWRISASRIWLLSGNEFAFANAVLLVGQIPIMYLPFFYYPKDELIFNPVFGYRKREGYYVQTTTYIIGRKPLDKSSSEESFFDFMKETELKKQVRQGLFLHNLSDKETDVSQNYLKIYADYYTNLGGMIGTEGVFKPKKVITDIQFSLLLGFSRNLYPYTSATEGKSVFLPVDPSTGLENWDKSNFVGLELPFRYNANFQLKLNYSPFRLSIDLPVYSDAFFKQDFQDRSENMDWINFLMQNQALTSTNSNTSTTATNEVTSFIWKASASITPKLDVLKPYIKTLSLSNYDFLLNFNSKQNSEVNPLYKDVSTERKFFYPSTITPGKANVTVEGTIFAWPLRAKTVKSNSTAQNDNSQDKNTQPIVTVDEFVKPEDLILDKKTDSNKSDSQEQETKEMLPTLSVSVPSQITFQPFTYSLDYSIKPSIDSLLTYATGDLVTVSSIKWDDFQQSYYNIKSPVSLTSTAGLFDSLFSVRNSFTFSPIYQRHPTISEKYYTKSAINQILYNDYKVESRDIGNSNAVTLKPLIMFPIFSGTSLSWNTSLKLLTTDFVGTVDNPEWEYKKVKWDKEYITGNNMTFNLSAVEGKFSQVLSVQANLPPLLDSYTGRLSLTFPYLTVSCGSGYKRKSENSDVWIFSPFTEDASIKLFDSQLSISQSISVDVEEKHPTSLQVRASFFGLSASYYMMYTNGYKYTKANGWKSDNLKQFRPYSVNVSFSKSGVSLYLWKNRINFVPSINTSIVYDMIRATNSYFTITPALTLKIYEFANLTFSSTSRNDVIFRYVQDLSGSDAKIPGETNPWIDLMDSFAFGDPIARQQSGFKLKSFSLTLEHFLHDWTLKSEFSIKPRLIKTEKPFYYDFSPYFSVSVVWKPMKSIKTTIVDEYGEFKLNPNSTSSN